MFDLLYKEYNKEFDEFIKSNMNEKGSVAEVIIYKLLKNDILLSESKFSVIEISREYRLRDLIIDYSLFSEEEKAFINNNSRLDFLLYSKIDKTPILAIEVDGVSFHNNKLQKRRDGYKDNILETIGLPLLRLSTDGSKERSKIIDCLTTILLNT